MGLITTLIQAVGPEQRLYEYGVLGIAVVILSVFGYKLFNIILSDRDKAFQQRDELLQDVFTKVLPAISKNTEVLEERQTLDREIIELIKDFDQGVAANTETLKRIETIVSLPRHRTDTGGV